MSRTALFKVVLILSIALNLVFVGAIAGHFLARPAPPHFGWMVREMDQQTREQIEPVLRERRVKSRELRNKLRTAQRHFHQLINEPELDREKVATALAQLRVSSGNFQKALHTDMLDILETLEPEQRHKVARLLMSPGRQRPPHRGPASKN